jgi:hypothetical protein
VTRTRGACDPVVASTLLHAAFVFPFTCGCDTACASFVALGSLSVALSVVWHVGGERRGTAMWLDYGAAVAWSACGLWIVFAGSATSEFATAVAAEIAVLATNKGTDALAARGWVVYDTGHAVWHIASAAKAVYIATLIARQRAGTPHCNSAIHWT